DRCEIRPWVRSPAHLVQYERKFHHAQTLATVTGVDRQALKSHLSHLLPGGVAESLRIFHDGPHRPRRAFAREELARQVAKHYLLLCEVEVHVLLSSPVSPRLTRQLENALANDVLLDFAGAGVNRSCARPK